MNCMKCGKLCDICYGCAHNRYCKTKSNEDTICCSEYKPNKKKCLEKNK